MPRNPNKKPCRYLGCRNWAMRGYDECRSHLDPLLGPRGGGAPRGNLNALKTGEHINPASSTQLRRLAHDIVQQPENVDQLLIDHVNELYAKVGYGTAVPRALRTVIALRETVEKLIPYLADAFFFAELEFHAQHCPPDQRASFKNEIWSICAPLSPQNRLRAILRFTNKQFELKRQRQLEEKRRNAKNN